MLDLSNNQLKEIPTNINELINLSVLNISGNKGKIYNFNIKYLYFNLIINFFRYYRATFTNGFIITIVESKY